MRRRRLMDRGERYEELHSDKMVHSWLRYSDQVLGLNGRYAADLRFHFYTRRNTNRYVKKTPESPFRS